MNTVGPSPFSQFTHLPEWLIILIFPLQISIKMICILKSCLIVLAQFLESKISLLAPRTRLHGSRETAFPLPESNSLDECLLPPKPGALTSNTAFRTRERQRPGVGGGLGQVAARLLRWETWNGSRATGSGPPGSPVSIDSTGEREPLGKKVHQLPWP